MTLPPKLEKLLENWPAKIISLVAAILVYAFYQISTLQTRFFVVPLEVRQDSGMVSTEISEDSIRISVRGDMTEIATLEAKDFSAFTDMSRYMSEGTVTVPVQLDLSDNARIMKDVEIKLQPETVDITLEKEVSEYIPVKLNYAGEAMHGYEITEIKAVPSLIKITGPRSLVEELEELDTDVVLVDEVYTDVSLDAELLQVNSKLTCWHEGPVRVEVNVVPSKMKRTLMNLPVTLVSVNENLSIEFDKKYASCSISGNELDVEKYNPQNGFIYADCSGITEPGEYDIPLQNKEIYQFNVESVMPETIHVTVTEIPVEETEEVEE